MEKKQKTKLEKIDSAFSVFQKFSKVAQGTTKQIQSMRSQVLYQDGAVPSKWKILGAVLCAIVSRCEPCVRFYAQKAAEKGVTEGEMGEFLAVASTMGGCVGEMWALKAFAAFLKKDNQNSSECSSACS